MGRAETVAEALVDPSCSSAVKTANFGLREELPAEDGSSSETFDGSGLRVATQGRLRQLAAPAWLHSPTMVGKPLIAAIALLTVAVSGCTRAVPVYESRYTPPASTTSAVAPPLPPGASWVDAFDRPDTQFGLGPGWDMRGAPIGDASLPPARDGFVKSGQFAASGRYASAQDSSVYAVRTFDSTVRRVGGEVVWTRTGPGGSEMFAMAISANAALKSDVLQLTATVDRWAVTARRARGTERSVMGGKFDPPLELEKLHRFEMDAADESVTVRVPGTEKKAKTGTRGILGGQAFWQLFAAPKQVPIGEKLSINTVWVAEEGKPLFPLPFP